MHIWCHKTHSLLCSERDGIFLDISVNKDVTVINSCSHHKGELVSTEGRQEGKNICHLADASSDCSHSLMCLPVWFLSCVWFFMTLWNLAHQAPLSMRFFRQEYWSGLPFPSSEALPNKESNPCPLHCRQILYHLGHPLREPLPMLIPGEGGSVSQFSCSVTSKSFDTMDSSTPSYPAHHLLPELTQTHVHWVRDAIQTTHPLSSPPLACSLSQDQGLFQWVSSVHHVAKIRSFNFSIRPSNEYSGLISIRIDWFDILAIQGTLKSLLQHHNSKASIVQHMLRKAVWSNSHIHTWLLEKSIALTRQTLVVMSLLFNMLFRFVIAFLSKSKHLLISWLQSPSAVILEPPKIKSVTVSIVSPSICHEVMGLDAMIFIFWMLSFKPAFSLSSFTFIKRLFSSFFLSAIRVVSSAYLRLLIFLLAILIPVCASSGIFHDVLCIKVG